jgi:hypothetical protein
MVQFKLRFKDSDILGLIARYHITNSANVTSDQRCRAAGEAIRAGHLSKENLRVIYRWKMAGFAYLGQEKKYFDKNQDATVTAVPRNAINAALAGNIKRAFAELQSLKGVGLPVASAILTALFWEQYTVIDRMAFRSHCVPEDTPLTVALYLQYLSFCDQQAKRLGVSIRDFDRALWQWGHENGAQSC